MLVFRMVRRRFFLPAIIALLTVAGFVPVLRAAPGDVKAEFALPCKYPAGLASDGRRLFVADWRTATIYEIEPTDGRTIRSFASPALKPSDLTFAAGKLYVCDDHAGTVYAMNADSGVVESTFQAPVSNATGLAATCTAARGKEAPHKSADADIAEAQTAEAEATGVEVAKAVAGAAKTISKPVPEAVREATPGQDAASSALFVLAGGRVYKVLPEDGTILGSFAAPDGACRCLAYDGTYLWTCNRTKDELYMLCPDGGKVINILKSPGPYPAGLAWQDGQLWTVDFQTRKLEQVAVQDEPMFSLSETRRAQVEFFWALNNYGPGDVLDLTVHVALPMELPNQKLLTEPRFAEKPAKLEQDRWSQPCATFTFDAVEAGRKATVSYTVQAELSAIRYLIVPERTGTLEDIPADIRAAYTVDASHLRVGSPYIQRLARKIVGEEKNCYWIARKIYDYVIDRVEYEMVGGWDVPEAVLERGKGSCSEYTYCFVALCRAAGLPVRYQGSVVARGDDASVDDAFHRWAQVYLPSYGWAPVDVSRGDAATPADQARGFGDLGNRFLITTQGGGDSDLLRWNYNSYAKYKTRGPCKVEEDNLAFWEPLEPTTRPAASKPQEGARECRTLPQAR